MGLNQSEGLRRLPAVHKLLADSYISRAFGELPLSLVTKLLGAALKELREEWTLHPDTPDWVEKTSHNAICARALRLWLESSRPLLRSVINATGTVLHTNLGRAPLSKRATEAVLAAAGGYSNLEYDLKTGQRGSRHSVVERRLQNLLGAEAACVVNNNAAAVLLVLKQLASGGEAIVSRGQLVEIGGSFRIPDVMEESGVALVEVGTTNKTHLVDYERAICSETRAIVRIHTSNYRILGFTEQPDMADLVELAHRHGLPVFEDLGSGALFDFAANGVGDEPTIQHSLAAGVDILSFSGDKLLGGSQAGIIVGKKCYVEAIRKHPLMRALRVDKLTLAALEATLISYEDANLAKQEVPIVRMLTESSESVRARASALLQALLDRQTLGKYAVLSVEDTVSAVGGGALPGCEIASSAIVLHSTSISAQQLFDDLRTVPTIPVVGRIVQNQVLLDVRTLLPGEDEEVLQSLDELGFYYDGTL